VTLVNPPAKIDQATALRAERERGKLVDPVDRERLAAGWTVSANHQPLPLDELDELDEGDFELAVEAAEEESLFVEESLLLDSPLLEPEESVDDFSALAAFL
jgi:hypothetical protein